MCFQTLLIYNFISKTMRIKFRKNNVKYLVICFVSVSVLYYFGAFTHLFEESFDARFKYPFYGDIRKFVEQLKNNEQPSIAPINEYNFSFILNNKDKCITTENDKLRLVYIVKSAIHNIDRRKAIRQTWGYEKRFSDVPIRTVFILGASTDNYFQHDVEQEHKTFGDIIQANFSDNYYNNTIKTMMAIKWVVRYCPNAKFYFFSDDDMYVSTKNTLRFVRNPTHYPEYLEAPIISMNKRKKRYVSNIHSSAVAADKAGELNYINVKRDIKQVSEFELSDDVVLYTGYVFTSSPQRHFSSKWYVSLDEYPYDKWPPYVTAGSYILSRDALIDMYYASLYTQHFRFDDVFLGLIAKKIEIEPFHCSEFHFYKKNYNTYSYHYVISSHGYGDPSELIRVWNEQKSVGNA